MKKKLESKQLIVVLSIDAGVLSINFCLKDFSIASLDTGVIAINELTFQVPFTSVLKFFELRQTCTDVDAVKLRTFKHAYPELGRCHCVLSGTQRACWLLPKSPLQKRPRGTCLSIRKTPAHRRPPKPLPRRGSVSLKGGQLKSLQKDEKH